MIDAGTGETRRVFRATAGTEELLVNNGLLLAQVNRGDETDDYAPARMWAIKAAWLASTLGIKSRRDHGH
ncbi:MAG: hypothetical protein R3C99_24955 [Pirellulaceae bacterium]